MSNRHTDLPAEPVIFSYALFITFVLLGTAASALAQSTVNQPHKAPPVVIVLFLDQLDTSKDYQKNVRQIKQELRSNPRVELLTYDPEAPTFVLAAQNAHIDPTNVNSVDGRLALGRAMDANLAVTLAESTKDKRKLDATIQAVLLPKGVGLPDSNLNDISASAALDTLRGDLPLFDNTGPFVVTAPVAMPTPAVAPAPIPTPIQLSPPAPNVAPNVVPVPVQPTAVTETPMVVPAQTAPPAVPMVAAPSAPVESAPILQPSLIVPTPTPVPAPLPIIPAPVPQPLPTITVTVVPPTQALPAPTNHTLIVPIIPAETPAPTVTVPTPPVSVTPDAVPHHMMAVTNSSANVQQALPQTLIDDATQKFLTDGDSAVASGDFGSAIAKYRQAIDGSPRNAMPRIKLASAYIGDGQLDRALDEIKRAGQVEPDSQMLRDFLQKQAAAGTLPGADEVLMQMTAASTPDDPKVLMTLGDSYWNSNHLDMAEQSYKRAVALAPASAEPYARLARLYAATDRYDECLTALSQSGEIGYAAALRVVVGRADFLTGDLDSALQSFQAGDLTRTQFYDKLSETDKAIASYAHFIGRITPPQAYRVSYLHRKLATNLLGQVTPALQNYALTAQTQFLDQAKELEKSSQQELSVANVADKLQQQVLTSR